MQNILFVIPVLFVSRANAEIIVPDEAVTVRPPTLPSVVVPDTAVVIETTRLFANAIGGTKSASQGTVDAERLKELPLLRPGQVLETVPGMVVTQHSGDGKANQYFLRGYNLDHGTDFSTLIDGVPVNMPTNAHGQGYSDMNYLMPELVRRIDYDKGPYFSENGDFSAAGSARVQYRDWLDSTLLNVTAGSFGYRRALLAGSTFWQAASEDKSKTAISDTAMLGALEVLNENGPWAQPEGLRKVNGLLRLTGGSGDQDWSVDGMYYDASWRATDQVPLRLIQTGQLAKYGSLNPTDGGNSGRAIVAAKWQREDEAGYMRASVYAQHYRLQLWSDFSYFLLRPTTGDQFEQAENRNVMGGEITKGWKQALFGHESTSEVGMQLRKDAIHVDLLNTQYRVPFAVVRDDFVNLLGTGVYAQNTTLWTERFRSVIGLREDYQRMQASSTLIPQNSGNASGGIVSPKLSLIFGPWYATEIFINAGKGFHSNDARGVIDKIDPTTGATTSVVPALVASVGKEIGLRTEAISGVQSSLALWSLNSHSELVYSADSSSPSTNPKGPSERYGVEWNNHIRANRELNFDADFAWTRARYATMNDNNSLGNLIPNAVAKVAMLDATLHRDTWSGGLETRYIGGYPLTQDGGLFAPSALVTNLRMQRALSPSLSIQFEFLNLFNREYYDIAYAQNFQLTPAGASLSGITVHPGEPRMMRLTLKFSL